MAALTYCIYSLLLIVFKVKYTGQSNFPIVQYNYYAYYAIFSYPNMFTVFLFEILWTRRPSIDRGTCLPSRIHSERVEFIRVCNDTFVAVKYRPF